MDIQTAQNAALAAIARLADAGHRLANEHAYALDQLRQENEALRRQNQALRERVAELERAPAKPVQPWTPKVGDRVRIAREPFEPGRPKAKWIHDLWGKIGDVGVVFAVKGDVVCVDGIGDKESPYWIDPSCLEPLPDVQPVDTEAVIE